MRLASCFPVFYISYWMSENLNSLIESSTFKWIWGGLVIICTAFFVVYVPLDLLYHFELNSVLVAMHVVGTVVFLADIGVNFLKIRNEHTRLEIGNPESDKEYLLKWFLFDVIAVVPFSLFGFGGFVSLLRLTKLVSVARIMYGLRNTSIQFKDTLRLVLTFYWILLITHWIACGWEALHVTDRTVFWMEDYLDSLYWAVTTITTVGYGDVTPEDNSQKIYAVGTMISGLVFYGYLIGNIAGILFKKDPAQENYLRNLERLATTAKQYHLPPELERKVYEHFTYQWKNRRGYFESDLLSSLPGSLKAEVSHYMKKDILHQVPIFQGSGKAFLDEISILLKHRLAEPGDYLFRFGDTGSEMFFLVHGRLEVIAPDGKTVVHILKDGEYFGEIALFKNQPRNASVRAISFCDLYSLPRDSFLKVLESHPEFAEEVEQIADEREKAMQEHKWTSGKRRDRKG